MLNRLQRHVQVPGLPRRSGLWLGVSGLLLGIASSQPWPTLARPNQPANNPAPNQQAPAPGDDAPRKAEQEVVLRREALDLRDPAEFRIPLSLSANRTVELVAPVDGVVRVVSATPGSALRDKAEVIRLDDARAQLILKRTAALHKAAQVEKQIAQGRGDGPALNLADARLEAAQAELELANFDADQLIVRAPFAGDLERLYVVEGEFVRAGQKLARLSDASQLVAEVPAERSLGAPGGTATLTVEGRDLPARIEALLPLPDDLAVVRELIASPVLARLKLDNPQGQFKVGQTVNSPWLPREPVCVVPVSAVANLPDGRRRVQVLRDSVIRNLSVRILGKVSEELVNVAGRFGPGDELIVASSRELADGTPLKAVVAEAAAAGAETRQKKGGTKAPAPPTTGF